ncbi:hypothetical protein B0H14DRAFT_2630891 [Mycena olivaceomarginata]|nr:hypothetical protein B0H14DRAFT_2630891 [Mycena olivaceomarginata]
MSQRISIFVAVQVSNFQWRTFPTPESGSSALSLERDGPVDVGVGLSQNGELPGPAFNEGREVRCVQMNQPAVLPFEKHHLERNRLARTTVRSPLLKPWGSVVFRKGGDKADKHHSVNIIPSIVGWGQATGVIQELLGDVSAYVFRGGLSFSTMGESKAS